MDAGRVLSGRYELEHELGAGGAAVVWRARDRTLDRAVAVKVLHPALQHDDESVARFLREARSAATLNHRNVVAIYDIGSDDEQTFIVMEYIDGPGLDDVLEGGALEPDTVAAVGYQVASAIGAAHDLGLIHRDIKPANILLSSAGQAKVADFGIAKAIDAGHTTLTRTGSMVGTVAYLAPEQIRSETVDRRADVYALGLVLHQALTGQTPFGRGTPAEVAARRLATDPPSLTDSRPDLPEDLVRTVARATRLDREERFADGNELAAALGALLHEEPEVLVQRLATEARPESPRRDDTQVLTGLGADATETIAMDLARRPAHDPPEEQPTRAALSPVLPSPGPPEAREESEESEESGRGSRLPRDAGRAILALLAGVVLLVGAWSVLGRDGGSSGGAGEGGGDGGDGSADAAAVEVASARDFDPFGDGEEHREDAPKAHDGDPGTAWVTERYNSADMGGLKPGVGLWFDLGASHDLARIELTVSSGLSFAIHVGESAPEGTDPGAWGTRVDAVEGATGSATVEVPGDVRGRYVLVWVTSVGGAGQRAEIAEARFLAR